MSSTLSSSTKAQNDPIARTFAPRRQLRTLEPGEVAGDGGPRPLNPFASRRGRRPNLASSPRALFSVFAPGGSAIMGEVGFSSPRGDGLRDNGKKILLLGLDVRALTRSAARFGHNARAIDRLGSSELALSGIEVETVGRSLAPNLALHKTLELARSIETDYLIYGSGFEDDIFAITDLKQFGEVVSPSAETARKCKSPDALARAGKSWNFHYPEIRYQLDPSAPGEWIAIPSPNLAGRGRLIERDGGALRYSYYYQKALKGIDSTAFIVSSGSESWLLGSALNLKNRFDEDNELTGEISLAPHPFQNEIAERALSIAESLTFEFDLTGIWEFDFVYNGSISLVSVRPTPSARIELLNLATMNDLLSIHIDATLKRASSSIIDPGDPERYHAIAQLKSKRDLVFTDAREWVDAGALDVPFEKELVPAGDSLITLKSSGSTYSATLDRLDEEIGRLRAKLGYALKIAPTGA